MMMYQATYSPDFYRTLHRFVHARFRASNGLRRCGGSSHGRQGEKARLDPRGQRRVQRDSLTGSWMACSSAREAYRVPTPLTPRLIPSFCHRRRRPCRASRGTDVLNTTLLVTLNEWDQPDLRASGRDLSSDPPVQQPLRFVRLVEGQRRRRVEPRRDRASGGPGRRRPRLGCSPAVSHRCARTCSRQRRISGRAVSRCIWHTSGVARALCHRGVANLRARHRRSTCDEQTRTIRGVSALKSIERGVARLRTLNPGVGVAARSTFIGSISGSCLPSSVCARHVAGQHLVPASRHEPAAFRSHARVPMPRSPVAGSRLRSPSSPTSLNRPSPSALLTSESAS